MSAGDKKKAGGGFLRRQVKSKTEPKPISEEELLTKKVITPDEVLRIKGITDSKLTALNCIEYAWS